MKKKVSVLMVLLLMILVGCSNEKSKNSNKKESETIITNNQTNKVTEKENPSEKLKKEAIKAEFVKINGHEKANENLKVYAEGKISVVDYEKKLDVFPSFILSQEEDKGFGVYHISNILGKEGLKDGDEVKIYGVVSGEKNKSGMPVILATIIEKK